MGVLNESIVVGGKCLNDKPFLGGASAFGGA
jgi:hypothetical protein